MEESASPVDSQEKRNKIAEKEISFMNQDALTVTLRRKVTRRMERNLRTVELSPAYMLGNLATACMRGPRSIGGILSPSQGIPTSSNIGSPTMEAKELQNSELKSSSTAKMP